MAWSVEQSREVRTWRKTLASEKQDALLSAIELLGERGPTLGRPLADTLIGSRYPNMKELRPLGTSIRVLFAFDPTRTAVLLVGGDKEGQWSRWYRRMIPLADRMFDARLRAIERRMTTDD